jgi:hypothetical protein
MVASVRLFIATAAASDRGGLGFCLCDMSGITDFVYDNVQFVLVVLAR